MKLGLVIVVFGCAVVTCGGRMEAAPSPSASSSSSSAPPPQFVSASGGTILPAGMFTLRYVGGAQSHDEYHAYGGAFEVTAHYTVDGIQAGHHLFDGPTLDTTPTNIWLDDTGLVADRPSVDAVEQANAGHTWSIQLAGGPLWITYLENAYGDNIGPGTRLCIDVPDMG